VAADEPDEVSGRAYVSRAFSVIQAGLVDLSQSSGLELTASPAVRDEDGWAVETTGSRAAEGTVLFSYTRRVLAARGPDKDPETSAVIYLSGLEERIAINGHALGGQEPVTL
jgi:hypothetical protein